MSNQAVKSYITTHFHFSNTHKKVGVTLTPEIQREQQKYETWLQEALPRTVGKNCRFCSGVIGTNFECSSCKKSDPTRWNYLTPSGRTFQEEKLRPQSKEEYEQWFDNLQEAKKGTPCGYCQTPLVGNMMCPNCADASGALAYNPAYPSSRFNFEQKQLEDQIPGLVVCCESGGFQNIMLPDADWRRLIATHN